MTLELLLVIVGVYVLFSLSGFLFRLDPAWYAGLKKPSWTPSPMLIGTVWAILYGLIALAFALVWRETDRLIHASPYWIGIALFNYIVNQAFTYFLFQRKSLFAAYGDCLLVAVTTFLLVLLTETYSPLAAWLLLPYLIWSAFATFLSWTIYRLNRTRSV